MSHSSDVVRSTGMALAWIGRTVSFDSVVKNAKKLVFAAFALRSPVHERQSPAKANKGRLSSRANQCVILGRLSVHSQNEVAGINERHCGLSHPRQ